MKLFNYIVIMIIGVLLQFGCTKTYDSEHGGHGHSHESEAHVHDNSDYDHVHEHEGMPCYKCNIIHKRHLKE